MKSTRTNEFGSQPGKTSYASINSISVQSALLYCAVLMTIARAAVAEPIVFTWEGDNNNNWRQSANWEQDPGAGDVPDGQNHIVGFDDTANRFNVDLSGIDRTVGQVSIASGAESYTFFNGAIKNLGNLVVIGDSGSTATFARYEQSNFSEWASDIPVIFGNSVGGTGTIDAIFGDFSFNAPGHFSGELLVETATVTLGHAEALQDAKIRLFYNYYLDINGHDAIFGNLQGAGALDIGSQTVTVKQVEPSALRRMVGAGGKLIKQGLNSFSLTGGINGISVQVDEGLMSFDGADGNIQHLELVNGNSEVTNGAKLVFSPGFPQVGDQALSIEHGKVITGRMTADPTGIVEINDPNVGEALTIGLDGSTSISSSFGSLIRDASGGPGTIRKVGFGTLTLTGSNTYSGGTVVDAGTLRLENDSAAGSGTITCNGGNIDYADGLTITNPLSIEDNANLKVDTGIVTQAGSLGENEGHFQVLKQGAGTLNLTGGGQVGLLVASAGELNITGGSLDLTSEIDEALSVLSNTTLRVTDGASVQTVGTNGIRNARVAGNNAMLFISGAGTSYAGTQMGIGDVGFGTATTLVDDHAVLSVDRIQIGDSGLDQTATGVFAVKSEASAITSELTFHRRATVTVDGGSLATDTISEVIGTSHTINLSDPTDGMALTIGTNDGNAVFGGLIQDASSGAGGIRKVGSGSLVINGANTYSGDTVVEGGTLFVDNTGGSATGSGNVLLVGGTLGGTGTVEGTAIAFDGGTVSPGHSVGLLTVSNASFESGSTLTVELTGNGGTAGTDFDRLAVPGNLTIQAGAILDLRGLSGFEPMPEDEFTIVTAASITGTFDTVNFPEGTSGTITYDVEAGTITVGMCFDPESDGDVDLIDYARFADCMTGPSDGTNPNCDCYDMDNDGDVDTRDFADFQTSFTGN